MRWDPQYRASEQAGQDSALLFGDRIVEDDCGRFEGFTGGCDLTDLAHGHQCASRVRIVHSSRAAVGCATSLDEHRDDKRAVTLDDASQFVHEPFVLGEVGREQSGNHDSLSRQFTRRHLRRGSAVTQS